MKNRIKNMITGLGITTAVVAGVLTNAATLAEVKGMENGNPGVTMVQYAQWTDEENGRGQITMEISGLLALKDYLVSQAASPSGSEEYEEGERSVFSMEYMENTEERQNPVMTDAMVEAYPAMAELEAGEEFVTAQDAVESEAVDGLTEAESEAVDGLIAAESEAVDELTAADKPTAEAMAESEVVETHTMAEDITEPEPWENDVQTNEPECPLDMIPTETGDPLEITEPYPSSVLPVICVVNYLSEYFLLDSNAVPENCLAQSLTIMNQKGEACDITKLICPIDLSGITGDMWQLSVPVILREEYKVQAKDISLPLCQDEPLAKDQEGTGAFVTLERDGIVEKVAMAPSPVLNVSASASDFELSIETDSDTVKAGERTLYRLIIKNTGELDLTGIQLQPVFSGTEATVLWEENENLTIQENQAVLQLLPRGESCNVSLYGDFEENLPETVTLTIQGSVLKPGNPQETIVKECSKELRIQALSASFTVEKTADRTVASPGDTITYQICIRNTGEKTLHSVIGTERFLSAGVYAQFVEQEGVTLNSSKTQALISQIVPGEAFALKATVTLPQYMVSQELINQVTVVARETGSRTVTSQAGVDVRSSYITSTPSPIPTVPVYYQSGGTISKSGTDSYLTSSKPKTGDDSPKEVFTALLIYSFLAVVVIAGCRWVKRKKR